MKKWLVFFLLILSVQSGFSFFRTQGINILDNQGNEIQLRGVGLGGWLVPEGYMLHVPGYGSPSYIDSLIRDLIGDQNTDQFWQKYRDNYVTAADVAQIANWGFNTIRLPFHYKLFYDPISGQYHPAGFALVDTLLSWCRQSDLYLILDMHCAPGGQNKDNISDSDGIEARLWTNPDHQKLTCRIWKKIARTYRDEPRIIGYDLLNEPVLPQGYANSHLYNLYCEITDSIRSVDSHHIIFAEGNWYATDFNQLTPPWDGNMVYSFHKYWSVVNAGSIQYLLDLRNQFNVPLWMGESGENSNHWFHESILLYQQNAIGWCWWTHKKFETITAPYSAHLGEGFNYLIRYWKGEVGRPNPQYALNAVTKLADNLKLNLCEYRAGIIPALFDPMYSQSSRAFANLQIPGNIPAVHYDLGAQGVAYSDQDFQSLSGGAHWNKGWQFRNDGVDIEKSFDSLGFAYNVGWIEDDEWLKYTVNIQTAGEYNANIRAASASGGGWIRLYLDGQILTADIPIPDTGGWQNWINVAVSGLTLPAGIHELHLSFPNGGFNLNNISFSPVVAIAAHAPQLSKKFTVGQNYPNPFNPATNISFEIPENERVQIEIYDHLGRKISTLLDKKMNAGHHRLHWNAENYPSAIYYYRIRAGRNTAIKKMILLK